MADAREAAHGPWHINPKWRSFMGGAFLAAIVAGVFSKFLDSNAQLLSVRDSVASVLPQLHTAQPCLLVQVIASILVGTAMAWATPIKR